MEEKSVKRENAMAAYNAASDETKKVLVSLLGEDFCKPQNIMDRIKTFEDACREIGEKHPLVHQFRLYEAQMKGNFDKMDDLAAFFKLRIITAALNEGWEPQFVPKELRWYPWFNLYTQEEIDRMSDEEKEEVGLLLWGGAAGDGSRCGLACADSHDAWSGSGSTFGSRLAFKSEELANYAGKQFIEIYADLCFKPEKKSL